MRHVAISLVAALAALASGAAAHDGCAICGSQQGLRKVCKPVPETKQVKVVTYECKCEDVCLAGRTQTHDCTPTCGRARTVKRLVKKETAKEVQSIKWVTTYICTDCCGHTTEGTAPQAESK